MLILHYAALTLVVALMLLGLLRVSDLAADGVLHMPGRDHTDALLAAVAAGGCEKIPAERWLGRGASFEVLDKTGKTVYSSRPLTAETTFSAQEIAFIPYYTGGWYAAADTYKSTAGDGAQQTYTEFRFYSGEDANAAVSGTLIVDEARRVVFSGGAVPAGVSSLTAREYRLLSGEWQDLSVYRMDCTLADGSAGTLLLLYPYVTERQIDAVTLLNDLLIPVFCVLYVLLALLFVLWLLRRVKKPLKILSGGMQALADGGRGAQLEYRGPAEFEQMCGSFNRMSTRLYEAEQQQKKAECEKQKMLADISHDLKTPITVIQGYAKAINDGLVPEEDRAHCLRTIFQKATMLNELIEAFHTYSKLEHPEFRLQKTRLDLCEVLREQLAAKYDEAELAGFSLEVEIPEKPLYVQLDALQFQRAVENVLSNALRHNPAGTKLLARLTPPAAGERMAGILLADSGTGIPPALAQHLFEPFAVGDESRTSGRGSGLGLAISKKILEAHGGSIRLLEPQGEWKTRFLLEIPAEG